MFKKNLLLLSLLMPLTSFAADIALPTCGMGYQNTELLCAAKQGNIDNARYAINTLGLDVNMKHPLNRFRPIHYAASSCHLKMISFLLRKGAEVNYMTRFGNYPLDYAEKSCGRNSKEVACLRNIDI